MTIPYRFGGYGPIEELQIHDRSYARKFFASWNGDVDSIRFELTRLGNGKELLGVDLLLRSGGKSLIVFGASLDPGNVTLPDFMRECGEKALAALSQTILDEARRSPSQSEIRPMSSRPRVDPAIAKAGRALPGCCDYTTATNHIRRYFFILDHGVSGKVLDCASGTGYGAAILSRSTAIEKYLGVDIDGEATAIAEGMVWDERFSFATNPVAHVEEQFDYVLSMETIEHTPNPYAFMQELIGRLKPDGAMIISIPTERWAGTHLNPDHLTNWSYQRFKHFVEQYFEEAQIYLQQLSLVGPSPLESAAIYSREPNESLDECFIAVLRSPKPRKRPTVVVKRANAVGDVLWMTPLLNELRRRRPDADIVAVTGCTEALMRNPDVDLVAHTSFEPNAEDRVIDLDGAYEEHRDMHILEAYSKRAGIAPSRPDPVIHPSSQDLRQSAATLEQAFNSFPSTHLAAVHAAATSPDRIWPAGHWRRLLLELQARSDVSIILLGHQRDFDAAALDAVGNPRVLNLVRRLTLHQTAAVLALSDLLICPDSGLSHVATAVGAPSLVLYSMANPDTRTPYRTSNAAIWSEAACRGCLDHLPPKAPPLCRYGQGKSFCMEMIQPMDVLNAALEMLGQPRPHSWRRRTALQLESFQTTNGKKIAPAQGNGQPRADRPTPHPQSPPEPAPPASGGATSRKALRIR